MTIVPMHKSLFLRICLQTLLSDHLPILFYFLTGAHDAYNANRIYCNVKLQWKTVNSFTLLLGNTERDGVLNMSDPQASYSKFSAIISCSWKSMKI